MRNGVFSREMPGSLKSSYSSKRDRKGMFENGKVKIFRGGKKFEDSNERRFFFSKFLLKGKEVNSGDLESFIEQGVLMAGE